MPETTTTQGPTPAEIAARISMEMFAVRSAVGVTVLLILLAFAMVFMKVTPDATSIGILMAIITPSITTIGVAFAYIYRTKTPAATTTTPTDPTKAVGLTIEKA